MRMETFYENPRKFAGVVYKVQNLLKNMRDTTKDEFELNALRYITNRLTEINFQVQFSSMINETGINPNLITVNDIDKIVRLGREFKAIFELKVRRKENEYIRIPKSQFNTLHYIHAYLGIPVFYLVKLPHNKYKLIELDFLKHYAYESIKDDYYQLRGCLLYTSPSPRDS